MKFLLKTFLITFVFIQFAQAGRFYSEEQGRFIQRDPTGYVDGMSLYNAYFAEQFAMDPMGSQYLKPTKNDQYQKDRFTKKMVSTDDWAWEPDPFTTEDEAFKYVKYKMLKGENSCKSPSDVGNVKVTYHTRTLTKTVYIHKVTADTSNVYTKRMRNNLDNMPLIGEGIQRVADGVVKGLTIMTGLNRLYYRETRERTDSAWKVWKCHCSHGYMQWYLREKMIRRGKPTPWVRESDDGGDITHDARKVKPWQERLRDHTDTANDVLGRKKRR